MYYFEINKTSSPNLKKFEATRLVEITHKFKKKLLLRASFSHPDLQAPNTRVAHCCKYFHYTTNRRRGVDLPCEII